MDKRGRNELARIWYDKALNADQRDKVFAEYMQDTVKRNISPDMFDWVDKQYTGSIQQWLVLSEKKIAGTPITTAASTSIPLTSSTTATTPAATPGGTPTSPGATVISPGSPSLPLSPSMTAAQFYSSAAAGASPRTMLSAPGTGPGGGPVGPPIPRPSGFVGPMPPPSNFVGPPAPPPFVGPMPPTGMPRGATPWATLMNPPPPAPMGMRSYVTPPTAQQQQQADDANMLLEIRRQKEAREKQKRFQEMATREEFADASLVGKAKMIMGGDLSRMGGMTGKAAGGVGAALEGATQGVNMINTLMDVTRELKMAKFATTPLGEAQATAAAQEKIPVIGKLLAGLTELASTSWKAHYAIREMGDKMHDANMQTGRFSFEMSQVGAQRTIKDIERSMKAGAAGAPAAAALEAAGSQLKDIMLPFEIQRKIEQDTNAAIKLLDEGGDKLFEQQNELREAGKAGTQEYRDLADQLDKLNEVRDPLKAFRNAGYKGDLPGGSQVGYGDTLPGWMDNSTKRCEEHQKKDRPGRFP